jgi:hypothetical protein
MSTGNPEIYSTTTGAKIDQHKRCGYLERENARLREELADAKEIEKMRDEEIASVREVAGNATIRFESELAEAKRETMQAIGLAAFNRQEAETQYERAEQAEAELADYKLWAEVEIADLREDLSDHIRMAKDAQEDAGRFRHLDRNWFSAVDLINGCLRPFTPYMRELSDRVTEKIDAAIKGSAT